MDRFLFNYYWSASSLAAKLFWLLLPVIFLARGIFVPYVITAVAIGWSAIVIAFLFRCPSCHKRALVHSGTVIKKLTSDRNWFQVWLLPNEFIYKYFYCCKCGHKIEVKTR
jgi:hypothetical protein